MTVRGFASTGFSGRPRVGISAPLPHAFAGIGRGLKFVAYGILGLAMAGVLLVVMAADPTRTRTTKTTSTTIAATSSATTAPVRSAGAVIYTAPAASEPVVVEAGTPAAQFQACGAWSLCAYPATTWSENGDQHATFLGIPGSYGVLRSCQLSAPCELTNNSSNDRWCINTAGAPVKTHGRGRCS